jgi:4a-hydroxytetrahydrobiopterin dehydratase
MVQALTDAQIQKALATLPGWRQESKCLMKKFPFGTYMDGIRFVETVAIDAESRDHHPDLLVRYGDITVFLTTHSAEGITEKDVDSARSVERLASLFGAR